MHASIQFWHCQVVRPLDRYIFTGKNIPLLLCLVRMVLLIETVRDRLARHIVEDWYRCRSDGFSTIALHNLDTSKISDLILIV